MKNDTPIRNMKSTNGICGPTHGPRAGFPIRILQANRIVRGFDDRGADERPLARSVAARGRFARIFALGDRTSPSSWTPGLIVSANDLKFLFDFLHLE